jgi:thiamine biosynthesis protein ThiS
MKIILNGEDFEIAEALSLSSLLAQLEIDTRRVAVEHNLIVVKREQLDTVTVREGDRIEVVNFVGGGTLRASAPA